MKLADIRNILVPIDFSKMSIATIETAKGLARRFGANIHLAHVHQRQYPLGFMGPILTAGKTPVSFEEHRKETLREELKDLAGRCDLAPRAVHLCEGASVFHELSRLARKISADLIVMPTHGRTGLKHVVLGSTAERMVQHSPCPVMVTRGRRRTSNKSVTKGVALTAIDAILVPVDFSSASLHALKYAIAFAERVAARLIVFHAAYYDDTFSIDGFGVSDLSGFRDQARRDAELQTQKLVRRAKFRGVEFKTVIELGWPVSEICRFAEQNDVDLIITATHGRTGVKHLLMGSVAEQVVRRAGRSVLVVPSHPEARVADLTRGRRSAQKRRTDNPTKRPATSEAKLSGRKKKLIAHPFPERRKTNKFRESHLT